MCDPAHRYLLKAETTLARIPRRFTDEGSGIKQLSEAPFGRQMPPEEGRFRLQVDRQSKGSYATRAAAKEAALAIKRAFPILHVAVFDAEERQSELIVLE